MMTHKTTIDCVEINQLSIEITRKPIRHIYLRVYPPDGRIRVSAPNTASDREIHRVIQERMRWIHQQRARVIQQQHKLLDKADTDRIAFLGRYYPIRHQTDCHGPSVTRSQHSVDIRSAGPLDEPARALMIEAWYRSQLQEQVQAIGPHWAHIIDVHITRWTIRKMRSRWGSCNITRGRVSINLTLIQYPIECLEYVIVHELTHMLERLHNARFHALLDRFMPDWRQRERRLRSPP